MIILEVDGIEMTAEKKRIKHMYIRVVPPDGRVKITAPMRVTQQEIKGFAASQMGWITKQRQKIAARPVPHTPKYESGESLYLWGRRYLLDVVYGKETGVAINPETLVLKVKTGATIKQREAVINSWYRGILAEAIPPVLKRCQGIVGVRAGECRIKNMRTKWGSCNISDRRIWLSLQLVKKPPQCLEYVIIHELVHLLERKHGKEFKAYMDRFYPSWRELDVVLNKRESYSTS